MLVASFFCVQIIPKYVHAESLIKFVVVKRGSPWERALETVCVLVQTQILAESKSKKHITSCHSHLNFSVGLGYP